MLTAYSIRFCCFDALTRKMRHRQQAYPVLLIEAKGWQAAFQCEPCAYSWSLSYTYGGIFLLRL